jgi:hypothetical protein
MLKKREEAPMKFSDYCSMIENTEKEQEFFKFLKENDNMNEVKHILEGKKSIPIVGKVISALLALASSESIAEFRQSEHYDNLKDWNLNFDPEKGSFVLNPGKEQAAKAAKIIFAIIAVIGLLVLCKKYCRRKKNKNAV